MTTGSWKLTQLGRKRAGSIYSSEAKDSVISYLYDLGTGGSASVEELALHSGKSTSSVRVFLGGLERAGMAERVGG